MNRSRTGLDSFGHFQIGTIRQTWHVPCLELSLCAQGHPLKPLVNDSPEYFVCVACPAAAGPFVPFCPIFVPQKTRCLLKTKISILRKIKNLKVPSFRSDPSHDWRTNDTINLNEEKTIEERWPPGRRPRGYIGYE